MLRTSAYTITARLFSLSYSGDAEKSIALGDGEVKGRRHFGEFPFTEMRLAAWPDSPRSGLRGHCSPQKMSGQALSHL
jgi:hypothetical protein